MFDLAGDTIIPAKLFPAECALENLQPENLNEILQAVESGDPETSAKLLPLLYRELRILAQNLLSKYPPNQTLQATALVHEAYLRLDPQDDSEWNGRGHFFAAAAHAMRRILVDQARRKKAVKHGGNLRRIELDCEMLGVPNFDIDFLALDEALDELKAVDERKVNVVLLRFLTGLTIRETANALDISEPTVERDWQFSRAFLLAKLTEDGIAGTEDDHGS